MELPKLPSSAGDPYPVSHGMAGRWGPQLLLDINNNMSRIPPVEREWGQFSMGV